MINTENMKDFNDFYSNKDAVEYFGDLKNRLKRNTPSIGATIRGWDYTIAKQGRVSFDFYLIMKEEDTDDIMDILIKSKYDDNRLTTIDNYDAICILDDKYFYGIINDDMKNTRNFDNKRVYELNLHVHSWNTNEAIERFDDCEKIEIINKKIGKKIIVDCCTEDPVKIVNI